ncbi:MAG: tRNA 2-selenouridine(34) synthase MnmH [Bacteroidota bacterium]
MVKHIQIDEFLTMRNTIPVVDVRSPAEFSKACVPGAYNVPLLNDEERAAVGTTYKENGRTEAIKLGLSVVGPKMLEKTETAGKIAEDSKKLILYCWRGGMRSENMAWLFSRVDIECYVLKGGYKTYRHLVKSYMRKPEQLWVLGGMTGSGKTELLHILSDIGEQVVDLEGLANHKGSAFGTIGEDPQPETEHFENLLFEELLKMKMNVPIWVEDESRDIGRAHIPEEFFFKMRSGPVFKVELEKHLRIKRLVSQYTQTDPQQLKDAVRKIGKRLGGLKTQNALEAIEEKDYYTAANIILTYYDKAYTFGLSKRNPENIFPLKLSGDNPQKNAAILKEFAYSAVS